MEQFLLTLKWFKHDTIKPIFYSMAADDGYQTKKG
jgi:hypothetical protein